MKNTQINFLSILYFPQTSPPLSIRLEADGADELMSTPPNQLYEDVLTVSRSYFGTAAQNFIDRQIANHLDRQPHQLQIKDLPLLIDWIKVSVAMLTDDKQTIDEYINQLKALIKRRPAVR